MLPCCFHLVVEVVEFVFLCRLCWISVRLVDHNHSYSMSHVYMGLYYVLCLHPHGFIPCIMSTHYTVLYHVSCLDGSMLCLMSTWFYTIYTQHVCKCKREEVTHPLLLSCQKNKRRRQALTCSVLEPSLCACSSLEQEVKIFSRHPA